MNDVAQKPVLSRWRLFLRLFCFVLLVYLVVTILFASLQRSLMYPAFKSGPLPAEFVDLPGVRTEDLVAKADDGVILHGWRLIPGSAGVDGHHANDDGDGNENGAEPTSPGTHPVILFLHGNGGNRAHRLDDADILTGLGAEIVLFDYRGYGENPGSPSEEGLAQDARAIWNFTTQSLQIPPERIVLFGESLGGGVAIRLAAELEQAGTPPGGIILRSTFTSMTDAASYHYPWLPIRLALLDRYASIERIPNLTSPLLILHGDADTVVPLKLGRKLYEAAPEQSSSGIPKRFVVLPGADHNDVLHVARDEFRQAVAEFLKDVIGS